MEDQTPPPEDKSEISKRSWIWIVIGLNGVIVFGFNHYETKLNAKDAEIQRLNESRVQIYEKTYDGRAENKRLAKELYKLSNWLFEKDTNAYRRLDFDSSGID